MPMDIPTLATIGPGRIKRLIGGSQQSAGECLEVGVRVGRDDDHELVTAESRDEILASNGSLQPAADLHEHGVARGMAVCVVDGLEPVQVAEDDGGAASRQGGQLFEEPSSVGQPGQLVGHRTATQDVEFVARCRDVDPDRGDDSRRLGYPGDRPGNAPAPLVVRA